MKSHGVYRASADLQKCGLREAKFAGSAYMLVKLQRPPPDMRIFLPGLLERSMSSTRRPRSAAVRAHISPAAPAPTITTSLVRTGCTGAGPGGYEGRLGVPAGASRSDGGRDRPL